MDHSPRVTVRRLMKWVIVAAVVLALVRYPYQHIRRLQHAQARAFEGRALVQSYASRCPAGVNPALWSQAVGVEGSAWANIVIAPEHIDDADLDAILAELRGLVTRATPVEAEGDLYHILDLLAHAKTRASVPYLSNMRRMLKSNLPGFGRPSPGLALDALSRLGPKGGEPALDAIIGGLRAEDWPTRVACCRAMGQYALGLGSQSEAEAAVTGLIRALDDDDPLVREIAVECLVEDGPRAARARAALIDRRARDPDVRVRWQAVRALPVIEKDRAALIPALVAALHDRTSIVRQAALDALGEMGPGARAALPAIREALASRDEATRGAAASATATVAPPTEVAVPALIDLAKADASGRVRAKAIDALAGLGAEASAALPAIIDHLASDDDLGVRNSAAWALTRIAPADPATIAALARALKHDQSESARWHAARALGEIGPPAAPAIPSLTDALKDPHYQVRGEAETALKKIRARP
jgi:HEAT repeat protein